MKYLISILLLVQNFAHAQTKISYYPNGKKEFEGNYRYVNADAEVNYMSNGYNDDDEIPSSNAYYFTSSPKVYEGPCTMWFENGNKKMQGNYILGFLDGKFTYWYQNGKLKAEGEYKLGFKSGLWKEWYKNGNTRTECTYLLFSDTESDSMYSDAVLYEDKPETQDIDNDLTQYDNYFDTHSKKNGRCFVYYESGSIELECFYTNDIKQGEWKHYYPNGKLEKTYTFKDGDCNGLSAVYKLDGSKLIEKNICKKEETILNVWNKEGEQVVKDGNGKFIDYDELGKKVVEGNITNGKKDGIWSYYRLDGSMQSLSNYQNGILLSSKFYENNGEIEQEQIYKNNKLKLTKYYEKGKVVEERSED